MCMRCCVCVAWSVCTNKDGFLPSCIHSFIQVDALRTRAAQAEGAEAAARNSHQRISELEDHLRTARASEAALAEDTAVREINIQIQCSDLAHSH